MKFDYCEDMNISRIAFYNLVKMQNHLNDLRAVSQNLSDPLQAHLELAMDDLQSEIQGLTSTYLAEVDRNRIESEIQAEWPVIRFIQE